MKKTMENTTHIEGILYEHALEKKVSGPNSKNPGTPYISGTISIATDDALTNIVQVHYSYVTAVTSKGAANQNFSILTNIIEGTIGNYMADGIDKAAKISCDSAIGLNEFYSDRTGKEELVSNRRNEGGFIRTINTLNEKESLRNTFKCDMIITQVIHVDADEERGFPEKATVKGAIFDFRKALLPIEFTAVNPGAISYYESLEASPSNPVFTKLWGNQISEVIKREIREESAFGDDNIREVQSTRKDFIITGGAKEPYVWDDESTITVQELTEATAARETYLATLKQRQDEYKASRAAGATIASTSADTEFKF